VAAALAVVHALDDAFLHRQPGVAAGQHALAGILAVAVGVAVIVAFPSLRPGLRAGVALVLGVLALVNGLLHLGHIDADRAAGSDFTGVLATAVGLVLIALAVAIPFLHRERAASRTRRWVTRFVGALAVAVLGFVVLLPVSLGIVSTHKFREPIGDPPSSDYRTVSFRSADGLRLSGWYRPSRNGAAVVLVHGGGGDRTGSVRHAKLLARHGYGVLLYDARGRGESEGSPNAYGWGWPKDVAGAISFLRTQPDVHEDRVGGLGLSTGADVLIEVAARRKDLRAIVADGSTARSFTDYRNVFGIDLSTPLFAPLFTTVRVLSGDSPGAPLEELVARVAPTPLLLIAAGQGVAGEREFNRAYAKAAGQPVDLWDLPEVTHTRAISERAGEYERRVVGLFERALLG
jgi:fermentation-respiration switch protein FrsA (DUF1100 family)